MSHGRTKGSNNGDLNNTGIERERSSSVPAGTAACGVKSLSPPCPFYSCEISYAHYRDALSTENGSKIRDSLVISLARILKVCTTIISGSFAE